MSPESVLSKTAKGVREIETRENKLDSRSRALLIMVNGRATAGELAKKFEQIGDIAPLLDGLAAQGFVEAAGGAAPAPGLDLRKVQGQLSRQLYDALGPASEPVTAKLEACKSLDELRGYLERNRAMLDEWLGKSKRAAFWSVAEPLLR